MSPEDVRALVSNLNLRATFVARWILGPLAWYWTSGALREELILAVEIKRAEVVLLGRWI